MDRLFAKTKIAVGLAAMALLLAACPYEPPKKGQAVFGDLGDSAGALESANSAAAGGLVVEEIEYQDPTESPARMRKSRGGNSPANESLSLIRLTNATIQVDYTLSEFGTVTLTLEKITENEMVPVTLVGPLNEMGKGTLRDGEFDKNGIFKNNTHWSYRGNVYCHNRKLCSSLHVDVVYRIGGAPKVDQFNLFDAKVISAHQTTIEPIPSHEPTGYSPGTSTTVTEINLDHGNHDELSPSVIGHFISPEPTETELEQLTDLSPEGEGGGAVLSENMNETVAPPQAEPIAEVLSAVAVINSPFTLLNYNIKSGGVAKNWPNNGWLEGSFEPLPKQGEGFIRGCPDHKSFGSGLLVDFITKTSREYARVHGRPAKLHVNCLSKQAGGILHFDSSNGHYLSHQNGLDTDLSYFSKNGEPWLDMVDSEGRISEDFDTKANFEFLKLSMGQSFDNGRPVLSRAFAPKVIKKHLCDWAKANGEYEGNESIFRRLMPVSGHKSHIHYRLSCAPTYIGCFVESNLAGQTACN